MVDVIIKLSNAKDFLKIKYIIFIIIIIIITFIQLYILTTNNSNMWGNVIIVDSYRICIINSLTRSCVLTQIYDEMSKHIRIHHKCVRSRKKHPFSF